MFNKGLQNKTSVSECMLIIELSKNNYQKINNLHGTVLPQNDKTAYTFLFNLRGTVMQVLTISWKLGWKSNYGTANYVGDKSSFQIGDYLKFCDLQIDWHKIS